MAAIFSSKRIRRLPIRSMFRTLTPLALFISTIPAAFAATPDLNADGVIDMADMLVMKQAFFSDAPHADLNGDGVVGFTDLGLLQELGGLKRKRYTQARDPDAFGISLSPELIVPQNVGQIIALDVVFNGIGDPILGGGFVLSWDPSMLEYVEESFEYVLTDVAGQPCDLPTSQCVVLDPPVVIPQGGLIEAAAGDFVGIGVFGEPVVVAQLSFVLLALPEALAPIALDPGGSGGLFACLISATCTGLEFFPSVVFVNDAPTGKFSIDRTRVSYSTFIGDTDIETFTLTNIGEVDASVTTLGDLETLALPFAVNNDGCTGNVLAPSQQCQIELSFTPTNTSRQEDALNIRTDANFSPYLRVSLTGFGIQRIANLTITVNGDENSTANFGTFAIGESGSVTIGLVNDGTADLQIGDIGIADPVDVPFFGNTQACANRPLDIGSTCTFELTFTPTEAGNFEDSLDINSNDPGFNTRTLQMSGSAITAGPDIAVIAESPPTIRPNFTAVGTYTVANLGVEALQIGSIGQIDSLAAPFAIGPDECSGTVLGTDETCTLQVAFAPQTVGVFSDTFDIPSNAPAEPGFTVPVEGTAVSIGVTVQSGIVSFAVCKNAMTGTQVNAPAVDGVIDCEAAGLQADRGNRVDIRVPAVAVADQLEVRVSGTGTDRLAAFCKNRTTQDQDAYLPRDELVRCTDAGIAVNAGDDITVVIISRAL